MKEVDILKKMSLKQLYQWLNNYVVGIQEIEGRLIMMRKRKKLIEDAIKEKEKE